MPENPSKDYYYIIRETGNTEPLLVEYGFIDNKKDAKRLNENIEKYAEGVVKAIATYGGYKYIPPYINNPDFYIVQKNDTLYSIANKFNISVNEIKQINNLTNDMITPGMKLYLTYNYPQATYKVVKNDTLYSIAQKFNVDVNYLKQANNLVKDEIYVGQELIIPSKDSHTEPIEPQNPITPQNPENTIETEIYIVKRGDSLWLIAKNNNISVDELIKLNNLTNINLQIGDKLLIPKQDKLIYTVQKGDTLWSIAKATNSNVEEIKRLNNLKNNLLSIGQQLILPK